MGVGFTQDEAQLLFDHLALEKFSVVLTFRYFASMHPAEAYHVYVPYSVGRMDGDLLRRAMEIADEHDADVHLISGEGLTYFKRDPNLEHRRRLGAA